MSEIHGRANSRRFAFFFASACVSRRPIICFDH